MARSSSTQSGDGQLTPEKSLSRVERKRAERVRLFLETAAQVFAQRGYDGTNLEEVGSRLDMRGASLYHYFPSKEELARQCIENTWGEVVARLTAIVESPGSPLERLRRLLEEQVLIQIRDYPAFVPLFLRMYMPVPELNERILEIRRAHYAIFERVANEAFGKPRGGGVDRRMAMLVAFGAISYVSDWYRGEGPLPPEEFAKRVAALVTDNLTTNIEHDRSESEAAGR